MKAKIHSLTIIFLITIGFLSCKEEGRVDQYFFDETKDYICEESNVEFFNDGERIFSYTCTKEWIELFFDIIVDETNDINGTNPNKDYVRIIVDYDNSGDVDGPISDYYFGESNSGEICQFFLLSETSTTFPQPTIQSLNILMQK